MYWNPDLIYNDLAIAKFKQLLLNNKEKIIKFRKEHGKIYDIYPERLLNDFVFILLSKDYKYAGYPDGPICEKKKITNGFAVEKVEKDGKIVYEFEGNVLRIINRLKRHPIYPHLEITVYSFYELEIQTEFDLIKELEKEEPWTK